MGWVEPLHHVQMQYNLSATVLYVYKVVYDGDDGVLRRSHQEDIGNERLTRPGPSDDLDHCGLLPFLLLRNKNNNNNIGIQKFLINILENSVNVAPNPLSL